MKSAAILDLLFYRLTQCGAITGTGCHRGHHISGLTGCCAIVYMGAAILEQQEQLAYKESFPTTTNNLVACVWSSVAYLAPGSCHDIFINILILILIKSRP